MASNILGVKSEQSTFVSLYYDLLFSAPSSRAGTRREFRILILAISVYGLAVISCPLIVVMDLYGAKVTDVIGL